ncbi:MAG: hypothetical protein A2289_11940 [Deltaproteobacteria bacterium RIFOXYA12_FULL_58_15]|nr:MAG: hypothetical protein A2289_11940 [Deltaproteobacteria bacterium RIFOXYA12_FULL_58_15]OGR07898.1 MAG: hypothetical protein A2341_19510 [Deltaproteobacteria bacterium RIFOXYB12_FULL_58_9]
MPHEKRVPQPHVSTRRKQPGKAFRAEILAMHRAIFRDNRTRINHSVFGYSPAFQRYEEEYARGVRKYQRRAKLEELDLELARATVAYVGDYHTLPQAQRAFLRLLKRLPANRPVTVALEMIQGRHQKHLDAYMRGRLSQTAFLRAVEHETHWQFGGWGNFREILELARGCSWRAIGIDMAGRGPAGQSLKNRDRYAARRIADELTDDPERLVMVLMGELHICPSHLPKEVDDILEKKNIRANNLIIYQNCHELFCQLESRGLEHEVELVKIEHGRYCLMNTPPIVCQQSFLNWLDINDSTPALEAPEEIFKHYARLIAQFFDVPLGDALDDVDITTVADLSFLARLRRRGDFSTGDMKKIREQILRSESYYIPRANTVYLGNLSVNHAAEEATHFLRHRCSGSQDPRLLVDAFYSRTIEEAVGFLGSKLINHKRKPPRLQRMERQAKKTGDSETRELLRLARKHISLEAGRRVRNISQVYECGAEMFNAVTHVLGYRLGERLYYGLLAGIIEKKEIRNLFFDNLEEEGAALATYLYFVSATASVKLPERF